MSATTCTRIYVGYARRDFDARIMVANILAECSVHNYTMYAAEGRWKGGEELALIIEVLGDSGEDDFAINEAAHVLRYNMDRPQEAVYIVRSLVDLVVI